MHSHAYLVKKMVREREHQIHNPIGKLNRPLTLSYVLKDICRYFLEVQYTYIFLVLANFSSRRTIWTDISFACRCPILIDHELHPISEPMNIE